MKVLNEWSFKAPWGNISLVSWGTPTGAPVLLVHGRQDSAWTFLPLLELLPEQYYYVGFDFPGHGYSDPYPKGVVLTRFLFITAVDEVVRHLRWSRFDVFAHSLGAELILQYSAIYRNSIQRMILLDPGLGISKMIMADMKKFFETFGEVNNAYHYDGKNKRVYSKDQAITAVMKARGFSKQQAEMVLERNLIQIGSDSYRLVWDNRLKNPPPLFIGADYYLKLFRDLPAILIISASEPKKLEPARFEPVDIFIDNLKNNNHNIIVKNVEGSHNVHFTNPESFVKDILWFLRNDFRSKAKL